MSQAKAFSDNIIKFERNDGLLKKVALLKRKEGDLEGAINFLFEARKLSDDAEIDKLIASVYSEMRLYNNSNQFAYYYIEKTKREEQGEIIDLLCENYVTSGDLLGALVTTKEKMEFSDMENDYAETLIRNPEDLEQDLAASMTKEERVFAEKRAAEYAFTTKNFKEAVERYNKIPRRFFDKIACYELACSYLYADMPEEAVRECEYSISRFGDNTLAYCVLFDYYVSINDDFNAKKSYKAAIESYTEDYEETHGLMLCAMDNEDDQTVLRCVTRAQTEDKYNVLLKYVKFIALTNLGKLERAEKEILAITKTVPEERLYNFYLRFISRLRRGDVNSFELLPLGYYDVLPPAVLDEYKRLLAKKPGRKGYSKQEKAILDDIREWGIESNDDLIIKKALIYISEDSKAKAKNEYYKILMDINAPEPLKALTIYAAIHLGLKRVSIYSAYRVMKVKIGNMLFYDSNAPDIYYELEKYVLSYATCISLFAKSGYNEKGRALAMLNRIYTELDDVVSQLDLYEKDLTAIVMHLMKEDNLFKPDLRKTLGSKYTQVKKNVIDALRG